MMEENDEINICLNKLIVFGGASKQWKDIPMELFMRIVSFFDDDRMLFLVSGVCVGWRDAISVGLTRLSLSWCKNNMNDMVHSVAPKWTKLKVLTLRQDKPQLDDNAIEIIANNCHDLQDLDISKSFKLGDASLYALARGCQNLVKLNISGCSAFSDDALVYLSTYCKKLKVLDLCGCVKSASDKALKAIGYNCRQFESINLGWCEGVSDDGVMSLAHGCPDLRALDLCGGVLITDESVIALANNCLHLRTLGLYYCQNITDRAMYALAYSRIKNKKQVWESVRRRYKEEEDEEGLINLNISQCTALTPPAVQALCDSFPALHTCPGRHSLIISGCLNLTSVHCACSLTRAH